ncbi:hypothetical protein EIP86_006637 [Pleurotus ostreatoroseus]|nr:hypothetical protein EIP86_006637 [Pleurotus ostreatoroseus]
MANQISYAPPSDAPPAFFSDSNAHLTELPNCEPLPPYTAKANDPLPTWASLTPTFEDLTSSERPTDLVRLPLDPPPDCFSTPSPLRIRRHSFAPFRIPSRSKSLASGFQLLYAPDELKVHGVSAQDWVRFLQDIAITARMSADGLNVMSTSPPSPRLSGWLRGRAGSVYDAAFGKSQFDEVSNLINVWNQSAFERRKLRISLHVKTALDGRGLEGYELLVEAL